MTLADAFASIESTETAARAALGSTLSVVLGECTKDPVAQRLLRIVTRRIISRRIAERALHLLERQPDPRFENPYDVALLLYSWLLVKSNNEVLAKSVFAAVAAGRNLWWSARYARLVLSGRLQESASAGEITTGGSSLIMSNEHSNVVLVHPLTHTAPPRLVTRISPSSPWQEHILDRDLTFGEDAATPRVLSNATRGTSSTGGKQ